MPRSNARAARSISAPCDTSPGIPWAREPAGVPVGTRPSTAPTCIRGCFIRPVFCLLETQMKYRIQDARSQPVASYVPLGCMLATVGLAALDSCPSLSAAELDPSKLPPAAQGKIDFERDIKPVF